MFSYENIQVDFENMSVHVNGQKIKLKTLEYKLLAYLVNNRNRTITKEEIFRKVWEDSITGDNTLNVHIRHLREKIEENPNEPKYIKTIWGTGYVFEVQEK
jgi:two-component system response regulator RegX3